MKNRYHKFDLETMMYRVRILARLFSLYMIFFCLVSSKGYAKTKLSFLPDRAHVKNIVLENETMQYTILLDRGIKLSSAREKATGIDFLKGNQPLMFISVRMPWWLDDVGYQLFTINDKKFGENVSVSITQKSSYVENPLIVTQTFSLGKSSELIWKVEMLNSAIGGRAYRSPLTITSNISFPLMQKIKVGNISKMHYLIPTERSFFCIDSPKDFIFYFTNASDPKMPIDIYNLKENKGIYFHVIKSAIPLGFSDKKDFVSRDFSLTQKPGEKTNIIECRILPHQGDWHAAFQAFKKYIRSHFDFTYYKRPIQKKYRQRFVSHFTFLYGHDIYVPESNQFRLNKFLDEGELNFGGYDYMLLWHDYPRVGLDDRDQFDMYQDLPGGLAGLKKMVDQAHARGVQVFIPYKPWDIMKGRKDHFVQEARIVKAIGADGIFLDTMNKSDKAFRDAVDEVNPNVVFVSEGRPNLEAAQLVTGSWNQQGNASNKMPNVDLFRFVFPEHNVHNINRGARKRDELIYNALFNGTGLIIWEDIFGEINRFTWTERILIHRYNRIVHENRDAYLTENPIPLVPNLRNDLFINAFPTADKCVYPVYQLGREKVSRIYDNRLIGPFMEVRYPENWHYVDVWNQQTIPTKEKNGKTLLVFPEEPADVMSCIIGMPRNLQVKKDANTLHISSLNPVEKGSIHVNTVNNLTMMENQVVVLQGSSGEIDLSQIDLRFPYKILVKLMQGDILKDEVILDIGWKKFF
ncbi:hypothetical protein J7K93_02720 [bacterium]|nr:hypothetical protein [bacterium]